MTKCSDVRVDRALALGAVSGAVGTLAMDLLLYRRARDDGAREGFSSWETAATVTSWEEASAPGQVGRKLAQLMGRRPPPDTWARTVTNLAHWATGVGWGVQYGLLAARSSRRWQLAALLGPAAWLSSYVVLPLAKVYQPIWEYDARVLGEDLSAHLVYGAVTGITFSAVTRVVR
jgi:hypothetical protein